MVISIQYREAASYFPLVQWEQVTHPVMSVFKEKSEELESYEFQMGLERGRLALALDLLTDALVLVGQHGVYCQSARQPDRPAMDIQIISKSITDAKDLMGSVMDEIRRKRQEKF
jgi:hypothetical protein